MGGMGADAGFWMLDEEMRMDSEPPEAGYRSVI
jgi:hypothetical protein